MTSSQTTASEARLIACRTCHLLVRQTFSTGPAVCPRCKSTLHLRKPKSISRTWALVIAAMILYIPANTLPIMFTSSFGKVQSDTILSGVMYLITSGMWPLAALVFFASIIVPILKLIILIFLLISVQKKSSWKRLDRARLFRLDEAIGRWSMLDIFVVTILVALVRLRTLATIEAGPAAIYFALVIILTMFAALSFDPRLIWDGEGKENGRVTL